MYSIMVENKSIVLTSKQDVMDFLYKRIEIIANTGKEICITINSESYILNIWIVGTNKSVVLFYDPLDSNEDCKISCSGNREEIDSPTFKLQDGSNSLMGCNRYNLISIEQAVKEIEGILNNGCIWHSEKWYSY